jgi:hypothetical protein
VNHDRDRTEKGMARLLRESAQTTPHHAVSLSVLSGTSMLTFTSLPRNVATALIGLVRLFA